jgi:hypothetical protein
MPDFLAEALTWPENKWAVPVLKASKEWGVVPLELLNGKKSSWADVRNRFLAVALTLLEDETCKSCGTPAWWGHSTDNEIAFKVESSVCYGCAELEKDRDSVSGNGQSKRKQRPGETRYVTPFNIWEGKALPSRYKGYTGKEN